MCVKNAWTNYLQSAQFSIDTQKYFDKHVNLKHIASMDKEDIVPLFSQSTNTKCDFLYKNNYERRYYNQFDFEENKREAFVQNSFTLSDYLLTLSTFTSPTPQDKGLNVERIERFTKNSRIAYALVGLAREEVNTLVATRPVLDGTPRHSI